MCSFLVNCVVQGVVWFLLYKNIGKRKFVVCFNLYGSFDTLINLVKVCDKLIRVVFAMLLYDERVIEVL